MASVIDRAVRTLRAIEGVRFDADGDEVVVPPGSADGFEVRLRMVNDRDYVVSFDQWRRPFDRAEDAYDCFEFGLSDSCRLRIVFRGDHPVGWFVEKREYGMWAPGQHPLQRTSLAFWRSKRSVYRQNHVFQSGLTGAP